MLSQDNSLQALSSEATDRGCLLRAGARRCCKAWDPVWVGWILEFRVGWLVSVSQSMSRTEHVGRFRVPLETLGFRPLLVNLLRWHFGDAIFTMPSVSESLICSPPTRCLQSGKTYLNQCRIPETLLSPFRSVVRALAHCAHHAATADLARALGTVMAEALCRPRGLRSLDVWALRLGLPVSALGVG